MSDAYLLPRLRWEEIGGHCPCCSDAGSGGCDGDGGDDFPFNMLQCFYLSVFPCCIKESFMTMDYALFLE